MTHNWQKVTVDVGWHEWEFIYTILPMLILCLEIFIIVRYIA